MAALSVLGLSTDCFTFLGFPPTQSKDRKLWFERLARAEGAAIFFEAPHRIRQTLEDVRASLGDVAVLVTRELTKVHEELVRGHISQVLDFPSGSCGEYTVVVEIGQITDIKPAPAPSAQTLLVEFGYMTKNDAASRRDAIATLARRYRLSVNDVYSALETAKKSGP